MTRKEFEYMEQPRRADGSRLVIRVSKIGGGTLGQAYTGRWAYEVTRVGRSGVLAEGTDLSTPTPKTHKEVVPVLEDFLHDLLDL